MNEPQPSYLTELELSCANGDILAAVSSRPERMMQKSALLDTIQQEIQRNDFSHFMENPPTIAEGGKVWL